MKESKIPLKIKLFKTRRYLADKGSNIRGLANRVKKSAVLSGIVDFTRKVVRKLFHNFKENQSNWMDRINSDEGFLIDS